MDQSEEQNGDQSLGGGLPGALFGESRNVRDTLHGSVGSPSHALLSLIEWLSSNCPSALRGASERELSISPTLPPTVRVENMAQESDMVSRCDYSRRVTRDIKRIYHPRGLWCDRIGYYDLVFDELLKDPTLPPKCFPSVPEIQRQQDSTAGIFLTRRGRSRRGLRHWDKTDA